MSEASSSPAVVSCGRCGRSQEGPENVTYGGELGKEIRANVCGECWAEWENTEVMVINELKLNFMDPAAQDTLIQHLREFLALGGGEASA